MTMQAQERRDRIQGAISEIPPFPDVATRVLAMARDEDTGVADLARAVSRDPGITAAVLRAANSASMGGSREISSLPDAILRLGVKYVRDVVVVTCLPSGSKQKAHPRMRDLWTHSVSAALAMRALSMCLRDPDPEIAFLAGLFQDIGRQPLLTAFPDEYGPLFDEPLGRAEWTAQEKTLFETDHTEIGEQILAGWEFDPALQEVARRHHDDPATMDGLVLRAAAIDDLLGSPLWEMELDEVPPPDLDAPGPAFERLGLAGEVIATFVWRIRTAVDREIRFFDNAS